MKIFGHPLHMMLIHFPAALFPMELVCYGIYYYTGNSSFGQAAVYALVGGVLLGWAAIIAGATDMYFIPAEKGPVKAKAFIHGSINTTVVIGYTVLAYSLYNKAPNLLPALLSLFIIKALLNGLMVVGNYLGGSLVLQDKVAVEI